MKPRRRRFLQNSTVLDCFSRWAATATETLEDRSLLSNLAISDAFLVDGNNTKLVARCWVNKWKSAVFTRPADSQPPPSYAIRFIIDGIVSTIPI